MIELGVMDSGVQESDLVGYFQRVKALTGQDLGQKLLAEDGTTVGFTPVSPQEEVTVSDVQRMLQAGGFYPNGRIDGICGYRTSAAIRLFQEYVRSGVGGSDIGVPNGKVGSKTLAYLRRWGDSGLEADWSEHGAEHTRWIAFLNQVKRHYTDPSQRTRQLRMVADHRGPSDSLSVEGWDFAPEHVHVVGVRRAQTTQATPGLGASDQTFDDVILLLVHGMVFKFQGSTEPGFTKRADGAPFLVQGQHNYRLGWHHGRYQALKPATVGVLVVRSPNDYVLEDRDLLNPDGSEKALEVNDTINVHWAGRGVGRKVNRWSEGCQVIAGSGYINHRGEAVSCAGFVALKVEALGPGQTKGAYNLMTDLVAVFSTDRNHGVKYTLLAEEDLRLSPEIGADLARAREMARAMK